MKSNPLLQGLNIPKTGTNRNVGILVTKTLLFAGDGTDPLFDAYDKETGALIAQLPMPAMQTGLPMTYVHQGRQFILRLCRSGERTRASVGGLCATRAGSCGWRQRWRVVVPAVERRSGSTGSRSSRTLAEPLPLQLQPAVAVNAAPAGSSSEFQGRSPNSF